jgi:hypothetical protein
MKKKKLFSSKKYEYDFGPYPLSFASLLNQDHVMSSELEPNISLKIHNSSTLSDIHSSALFLKEL